MSPSHKLPIPILCAVNSMFSMAAATDCTLQSSATRSSTDNFLLKFTLTPNSLFTKTITGACCMTFILTKAPLIIEALSGKNGFCALISRDSPCSMTRRSSSLAFPLTTVKCQGCRFLEDGAAIPASRIVCSSSSERGASLNLRILRRFLTFFTSIAASGPIRRDFSGASYITPISLLCFILFY